MRWDIVTSLENYSWRSDLSEIEIISDKRFIERTKDGYATNFTEDVTAKKVFMKPFVKAYLHIQQNIYIRDLSKALEKHYEVDNH